MIADIEISNKAAFNHLFWIDWMKSYAVLSIIFHHWLHFLGTSNSSLINKLIAMVTTITGNSIHLFFIASGTGLTLSFLSKPIPWKQWYQRRLIKILVPFWTAVTISFIVVTITYYLFPHFIQDQLTVGALVHNLVLTRNFFPAATKFNLSLWFIPNIVGLYCVFPLLMLLMRKMKGIIFLSTTLFITFLSFFIFTLLKQSTGNLHSIFPFFIFEFSFGMYLGHCAVGKTLIVNKQRMIVALLSGICFYAVSFVLTATVSWGNGFNKPFTALGIFFIISIVIIFLHPVLHHLDSMLSKISSASYSMYLIHFPIMYYYLNPLESRFLQVPFSLRCCLFFVTYSAFCGSVYAVSPQQRRKP